MVDAPDSKSGGSDIVWVQVPPQAPNRNNALDKSAFLCYYTYR